MELQQLQETGTILGSAVGGWVVSVLLWLRYTKISADYSAYLKEQARLADERARAAESRLDELRHVTRPTISHDERATLIRRSSEVASAPGD